MAYSAKGLPCKFPPRGSHFHPSWCPPGTWEFCRKVRFLGQNPKIGYQKFNDLQTAKISKKQLCDRTTAGTITYRDGLLMRQP